MTALLPAAQVIDQFLTAEALDASTLSPSERQQVLAWQAAARDFAADDPGLWEVAERMLAALRTLRAQLRDGAINQTEYETRGSALFSRYPLDVFLTVLNLQRAGLIAWQHIANRHSNMEGD